MRTRCRPALSTAMTLAAALLPAVTAQAGVQAWARSEAQVRAGTSGPVSIKADPNDAWVRQVNGFTVFTEAENFAAVYDPLTLNPTAATARASFSLERGLPRMELLTGVDPGAYAYTFAGGMLTVSGSITGKAGAHGTLTFEGSFEAAVTGTAGMPQGGSGADVSFNAALIMTGAGQDACRFQRCMASDTLRQQFENGSLPAGEPLFKPFSLSLEATVGDSFELTFGVAATASNGYYVLVGQPKGVPLRNAAALTLSAEPTAAGITGIRLSNGLGLSADSGMELQADGLWTAPSPVPEPAAAWLLGAGLTGLWLRRRLRGYAA